MDPLDLLRRAKRRLFRRPPFQRTGDGDIRDIEALEQPFRDSLLSMYRTEPQLGPDGQMHAIDDCTRISPGEAMWIYRLYCDAKPKNSIEIGMAYGFSTTIFMAALTQTGAASHVSVDPFQSGMWKGIGRQKITSLGLESKVSLIEDYSFRVGVDMVRAGRKFDFIFIDGGHRFDDVLMDFTIWAEVCAVGGHIVLDDMWMPSIRAAVAYLRANRTDFEVVPSTVSNVAAFRRISPDKRKWNHFMGFETA